MIVAIASEGNDEKSMVSEISGRAPYYLLYKDGKLIETIKNPFLVGGGAGFSVAQMLSNKKVDLVIAGEFGPNIKRVLDSKGIKMKSILGKTVEDVLGEIDDGKA